MIGRGFWSCVVLAVFFAGWSTLDVARAAGQPAPHGPNKSKGQEKTKAVPHVTPQREAAAMKFAHQYHPELVALLVYLKENKAREYHRAVSDLSKVSERLAQIESRDAGRHKTELKSWQLKSRIQLLTARLRIDPEDDALRAQLEKALTEQANLHKSVLLAQRRELAAKLKALDAQIEKSEKDRRKQIERQIESLVRRKKKDGKNPGPADGKPATATRPAPKTFPQPDIPGSPPERPQVPEAVSPT
ncbi:MAG: hypothetical protein HQ581_26000 [Planctomycetes bacterium]|nr:hypothetical protein [Planctomycetota bacterium]